MALNQRNHKRENTTVLLVFLFAILQFNLTAQNDEPCRVLTNDPVETRYGYRAALNVEEIRSLGYTEWEHTQNLQVKDQKLTIAQIPNYRRSYELRLNKRVINLYKAN